MKHRVSISVDESTIHKVRESIRNGIYRNKSHAFESAINKVIGE
jgi:Arc/MetJ-type ribon-helix-helix transcriptional regulator